MTDFTSLRLQIWQEIRTKRRHGRHIFRTQKAAFQLLPACSTRLIWWTLTLDAFPDATSKVFVSVPGNLSLVMELRKLTLEPLFSEHWNVVVSFIHRWKCR